jgi:hypothetical protein
VVDFSELSGMELVHTLKIEIVPDGIIYMCANLKKIGSRKAFVSRVQIGLYSTDSRLSNFRKFFLTLSQFGNAITSWILGVSLCMSTRL